MNVTDLTVLLMLYLDETEAGFPMCSYLRERGCQIGRNARMLSCHSPPRAASSKQASMVRFDSGLCSHDVDIEI